jgi:uncharacterized protein (DUF697 family)
VGDTALIISSRRLSMVAAIIKLHGFDLRISAGPCCTAEIACPRVN